MNINNINTKDLYNSYLFINIQNLVHNLNIINNSLPNGTTLMPVLKCDAYGLGVKEIAKVIKEKTGAETIAVAQVYEAMELRNSGYDGNILVMGAAIGRTQTVSAAKEKITLTAYRPGFFRDTASLLNKENLKLNVHIKINSGLNRLGYSIEELASEIDDIKEFSDTIRITGIFSHFTELVGCDENAEKQFSVLSSAISLLEENGIECGTRHICASAGYEFYPEYSLDSVRLGRKLYYDNVECYENSKMVDPVSWRAPITDIRLRSKGETVGYGGDLVLDSDTTIAMVGVGYGDCDLLRKLADVNAPVLVCGKRGKIISCCMDQCFIDISGIDSCIGDEVTFFGYDKDGNLLPGQYVASLIDDEACSLTASLGKRVLRIYE